MAEMPVLFSEDRVLQSVCRHFWEEKSNAWKRQVGEGKEDHMETYQVKVSGPHQKKKAFSIKDIAETCFDITGPSHY